jgi:hypothetical protein
MCQNFANFSQTVPKFHDTQLYEIYNWNGYIYQYVVDPWPQLAPSFFYTKKGGEEVQTLIIVAEILSAYSIYLFIILYQYFLNLFCI